MQWALSDCSLTIQERFEFTHKPTYRNKRTTSSGVSQESNKPCLIRDLSLSSLIPIINPSFWLLSLPSRWLELTLMVFISVVAQYSQYKVGIGIIWSSIQALQAEGSQLSAAVEFDIKHWRGNIKVLSWAWPSFKSWILREMKIGLSLDYIWRFM